MTCSKGGVVDGGDNLGNSSKNSSVNDDDNNHNYSGGERSEYTNEEDGQNHVVNIDENQEEGLLDEVSDGVEEKDEQQLQKAFIHA